MVFDSERSVIYFLNYLNMQDVTCYFKNCFSLRSSSYMRCDSEVGDMLDYRGM